MSHHRNRNLGTAAFNGPAIPDNFVRSREPHPHQNHPLSMRAPVAKVQAVVVEYQGEGVGSDGGQHQHFTIRITRVLSVQGASTDVVSLDQGPGGANCWVAARYGSLTHHADKIDGLDPGVQLTMQGEYITADRAKPGHGNPGLPVLHFTHNPVGFIQVGDGPQIS